MCVAPEEYDPYAKYSFGYAVNDPHRGDFHQHHESKEGGVVKGQYSLLENDGVSNTYLIFYGSYHHYLLICLSLVRSEDGDIHGRSSEWIQCRR